MGLEEIQAVMRKSAVLWGVPGEDRRGQLEFHGNWYLSVATLNYERKKKEQEVLRDNKNPFITTVV